jgi:hypothetical protein
VIVLSSLRRAARRFARGIARAGTHEVVLVRRTLAADDYGRVASVTERRTALAAVARFPAAVESAAEDGPARAGECVLIVDAGETIDAAADRVEIDGTPYRIVRIVPDAVGGLARWHGTRVR